MQNTELALCLDNAAYNEWVDNKLKISAQDDSEGIPHDEFMKIIDVIIIKAKQSEITNS